MNTGKTAARIVGVLFITGTVAGILSAVVSGPILDTPDYLAQIAANENQFLLGALLVLTMGLSLALIPAVIYPVLKQHHATLAMGYVVFRGAIEATMYLALVISWLLLLVLAREAAGAAAPDGLILAAVGALLKEGNVETNQILKLVFSLGSLMLNYALFRSRLVPRWLSGWGLIAVVLHFLEGLFMLFGVLPAAAEAIMFLPIALQEMVFAVWLIVKGFNATALETRQVG